MWEKIQADPEKLSIEKLAAIAIQRWWIFFGLAYG